MRKREVPEIFEYIDLHTSFETTDKELAVIVFEYAKNKTAKDFDSMKKECVVDLSNNIKRLKNEIKKNNGRKN